MVATDLAADKYAVLTLGVILLTEERTTWNYI